MTDYYPLTGVDINDPIPGIIREIKFAQGLATTPGQARTAALFGNKTTAGSEVEDTLGEAIGSEAECVTRFGAGSEIHLGYRSYVEVNPKATIRAIAVPPGTGSASRTITLATNATGPTTLYCMCIGETIEVGVNTGDTPTVVALALKNKINLQLHWPVSADSALGVVTATAKIAGKRHAYEVNSIRAYFKVAAGMTVTVGALTPGTTDDDMGTALEVLAGKCIYYQVSGKTQPADVGGDVGAPTTTDGGIGEHVTMINTQAMPYNGKGQQVFFALCSTQAKATSVTIDSDVNAVRAKFVWAENNDWTPMQIAAHTAAAHHLQETAHPGANLTDYGLKDDETFSIAPPYSSADLPTETEIRACLNNGITPLNWTLTGQGYVVRSITSRSLLGAVNDYRAREGHIPSTMDYYWETLFARYFTFKQQFIAGTPAAGSPPLEGVTYPSTVRGLHNQLVDDLINFAGGPVLDPDQQQAIKDSFTCVLLPDGISCRSKPVAVKHNNRAWFLIEESGAAY